MPVSASDLVTCAWAMTCFSLNFVTCFQMQILMNTLTLQEQGQMVPQPDEALSAALCSAIHGAFTKGSRQVAALKLVVSCLQAIPSVDSIDKAALKASVEAAQATSPSEKVRACAAA